MTFMLAGRGEERRGAPEWRFSRYHARLSTPAPPRRSAEFPRGEGMPLDWPRPGPRAARWLRRRSATSRRLMKRKR